MTYEEIFIAIINSFNRPLKAKELLDEANAAKPTSLACLRQCLTNTCKKGVIARVKIVGSVSFYCKPEWVFRSRIKGKFNFNPYWNNKLNHESKSIQVQQSSDSLGGTTRLPIQQGEANP